MDGYLILESNSNFLLFFSISHYSPWVMALIDETVKTPFMLAWPFFSHSQDLPAEPFLINCSIFPAKLIYFLYSGFFFSLK